MANISLVSPEDNAVGVGTLAFGKVSVPLSFFIGDSSEPWGEGDCSGWELYMDGEYVKSSSGWKSGLCGTIVPLLDFESTHTWRIAIIVRIDEHGGWERVWSGTWSFTTRELYLKAINPTPEHLKKNVNRHLSCLTWEFPE